MARRARTTGAERPASSAGAATAEAAARAIAAGPARARTSPSPGPSGSGGGGPRGGGAGPAARGAPPPPPGGGRQPEAGQHLPDLEREAREVAGADQVLEEGPLPERRVDGQAVLDRLEQQVLEQPDLVAAGVHGAHVGRIQVAGPRRAEPHQQAPADLGELALGGQRRHVEVVVHQAEPEEPRSHEADEGVEGGETVRLGGEVRRAPVAGEGEVSRCHGAHPVHRRLLRQHWGVWGHTRGSGGTPGVSGGSAAGGAARPTTTPVGHHPPSCGLQ